MKITFLLPGIAISGGVRSTLELANRLHERGHDVTIVYSDLPTRAEAKWDCREILRRVRAISKGVTGNHFVGWFDLKARLIKVPTFAQRYIPDGDIIVATWWGNAYDVDSYGAVKGEKFYFVRHYETWGGPAEKVDKSYTLRLHKLVTSTWLKNILQEKFNTTASGPLTNAVNTNLFYKEKSGFENHHPRRIGILYRQLAWKGMKEGIEAFKIAKKKHPEIKLVLFGEPQTNEDAQIVRDLGDVEFHALPYKDAIRKIYNSLDIFVFPSHHEGFGNPPMEAMACGAACITTCVGAVPDYTLAGKTALIARSKDPEDLAANIIRLLDSEKERQQIAENGWNHIRQFTWEKTATDLEKIFETRIKSRPEARIGVKTVFFKYIYSFCKKPFSALMILLRGLYWLGFGPNRRRLAKIQVTYKAGGLWFCWQRAVEYFASEKYAYEPFSNQLSAQQSEFLLARYPVQPLISIVVPVYQVPAKWLEKCIDSVCRQHYANWELILVDDDSGCRQLTAIMNTFAAIDTRIKVYKLDKNAGIAGATNFGIKQATGKFIGLLDHDDELTPDALTWAIWAFNKNPDALWLYSDEDMITTSGHCHSPRFKPDFSPEFLLSNMFTCHFSIYSAQILAEASGFRTGFDGSQDHDLALRLSEIVAARNVVHIPRVLYHWRQIQGSAATDIGAKPRAVSASIKAVQEALCRRGLKGNVTSNEICPTLYQIALEPTQYPKVSILIPTRNALYLVKKCIDSVRKHTRYPNFEILVINNGSDDPAFLDYIRLEESEKRIKVVHYNKPFNHSEMNNIAVNSVDSEFIVFMNNDIEIISNCWLEQLIASAQIDNSIAAVGGLLLYPDGKVQDAGIILGIAGAMGHAHKYILGKLPGYIGRLQCLQEMSAIAASMMLMPRSAFEQVGGFDISRYPIGYNDLDLCMRLRKKGYRFIYNPMVKAIHHETKTRPLHPDELVYRKRFMDDYADFLGSDPFYNPNLTLQNEQFRGFRPYPVEVQIPELVDKPKELS